MGYIKLNHKIYKTELRVLMLQLHEEQPFFYNLSGCNSQVLNIILLKMLYSVAHLTIAAHQMFSKVINISQSRHEILVDDFGLNMLIDLLVT